MITWPGARQDVYGRPPTRMSTPPAAHIRPAVRAGRQVDGEVRAASPGTCCNRSRPLSTQLPGPASAVWTACPNARDVLVAARLDSHPVAAQLTRRDPAPARCGRRSRNCRCRPSAPARARRTGAAGRARRNAQRRGGRGRRPPTPAAIGPATHRRRRSRDHLGGQADRCGLPVPSATTATAAPTASTTATSSTRQVRNVGGGRAGLQHPAQPARSAARRPPSVSASSADHRAGHQPGHLQLRHVADAVQHQQPAVRDDPGGLRRDPHIDQAVLPAPHHQRRRADRRGEPPQRARPRQVRPQEAGDQPAERPDVRGGVVLRLVAHPDLLQRLRPALVADPAQVGHARLHHLLGHHLGGELGQAPGGQPLTPRNGQHRQHPTLQRTPEVQERQGRRDQGEGTDQVRPEPGHLDRDRTAQRVAEQVHRPPAGVLDPADDPVGEGRDRVTPARLAAAEPGQVDRLTVEPVGEQPGQVGPVLRRAAQPVHVQRRLGAAAGGRGVPDVGDRAVEADLPAGPRRRDMVPGSRWSGQRAARFMSPVFPPRPRPTMLRPAAPPAGG